jgi:hypothetical protein
MQYRPVISQPDKRLLALGINRGYAAEIYIQRTWGACRESQILRGRTLKASTQSDC